ncbi:hypothetical protein A1O7_06579 [Cladophialophora yegresii CBS 114405]|uniref:SET domain-containing protein n=1 Tax=Cladophialophora yegresii CBS 114405 TaxID=1182544 RepID=W9VUA3_9EURO|nr:uncharacterized protein A1O7_06579 [Cladophialophora yegresii CBS 114405]EXJ59148.1 hypothetical protein A1O7_06579 [Cladophialophora yegresii CBS 114405]
MTTYTRPPQNWPTNLPYLSTVHLDSSLAPSQRELVQSTRSPDPDAYMVSAQSYPQSGLFAARQLAPGTHIIDYTGLLHSCPLSTCSISDYDLAFLDRDASIAIDGAGMGNEARFINDYHGVRDGPNAVFEEYYVKVKGPKGKEMWEARMGVWVNPLSTGVAKGEEICLSYGKGYWRARLGAMEQRKEDDSRAGAAAKNETDLSEKVMSMTVKDGKG